MITPQTTPRLAENWFDLFNRWEDDKWSILFGTGYKNYSSPHGIDGLARVQGETLDILAVFARHRGRGEFRRFMQQAKQLFPVIEVWEVWNKDLAAILKHYGFRAVRRTEPWGERLDGFRWEREATHG